jgi:uncharacterized protein YacL
MKKYLTVVVLVTVAVCFGYVLGYKVGEVLSFGSVDQSIRNVNESATTLIYGLALIAIILMFYFAPSFVAIKWTKKQNWRAILVLNILTGWTIAGWIICLVWAILQDKPSEVVIHHYHEQG